MAQQVLMFHIGTNNWQRQDEFAPGSGILHASMHDTFNSMPGVKCYSIYPSKVQTSPTDDHTFRVFKLDHDIPICESVSPNSSYRWHSMSEDQFTAYRKRLENEICAFMDEAEVREGREFDYLISHHAFTNAMTGAQIVERRSREGKSKLKHFNFVHGTALKMYIKEAEQDPEYPLRFLPLAQGHGVFNSLHGCAGVWVNSEDYILKFLDCFGTYPKDRCVFSRIGVNQKIFCPKGTTVEKDLEKYLRPEDKARLSGLGLKRVLTFIGKFADWKRLDAVLYAAELYEKTFPDLGTVVIGSGPPEAVTQYEGLAKSLGLQRIFFIGSQSQDVLADVLSMSEVGVFPSYKEPFGMVFIECMACGTPAIGAKSGGPTEFLKDAQGFLIDEEDDWRVEAGARRLGAKVSETITKALKEDWKGKTKGPSCVAFVRENYSTMAQCSTMLSEMKSWSRLPRPTCDYLLSDGRKVKILDDEAGIAGAVCHEFIAAANHAIAAKGAFSVALPGGSIVAALEKLPKGAFDPSLVHVFFVNERIGEWKCYKGVLKSLVTPHGIPESQVHKVTEGSPEEVAARYEALLRSQPPNVVTCNYAGMPSVDLVLLGTGEDGHVGSLHPNKNEIRLSGQGKAVLPINEGGKTSIAVSVDFIRSAKCVVLSAAKASRAPMVARALRSSCGAYDVPASMVNSQNTIWLCDRDSIKDYAAKAVFDPAVADMDSFWEIPGMKPGVITGDLAWALLRFAKAKGFAIPAINCTTTSTVNAVLEAASQINRPVIIQFSEGGSCFFAGKSLDNKKKQASVLGAVAGAHYVRAVAPAYGVPVLVHSDHCAKKLLPWFDGMLAFDEEFFKLHGEPLFSSHMLDLSEEPHEENIGICKTYLQRMVKVNLILEMEIGITGGVEDGVDNTGVGKDKLYSTPEDVWQVWEALAPISEKFLIAAAFGNVHGVYKPGNVVLQPNLLRDFQAYAGNKLGVGKPYLLVFHGGSGSEKEQIAEARRHGVVKMNVDTDTQWAYWSGIKEFYEKNEGYLQGQIGNPQGADKPNKNYYDPRKWNREAEVALVERVKVSCADLANID
mmetsp:Transcript_9587/g.21377  ORF Transcript_9587/g.21377 Transcript_9587/m.21377 type:complete len:1067 (-) Transcript_9587:225-3425(-)